MAWCVFVGSKVPRKTGRCLVGESPDRLVTQADRILGLVEILAVHQCSRPMSIVAMDLLTTGSSRSRYAIPMSRNRCNQTFRFMGECLQVSSESRVEVSRLAVLTGTMTRRGVSFHVIVDACGLVRQARNRTCRKPSRSSAI